MRRSKFAATFISAAALAAALVSAATMTYGLAPEPMSGSLLGAVARLPAGTTEL